MFRKSICLSALLALGMVGSSFAQNLTDSAQAQVGFSSNSSSGEIHSITPQMIHSVPSELVADDSTNGPNAIAGNPGGVPNVISVPNFSRSFTVNGVTFPYTMVGNDPSWAISPPFPPRLLPSPCGCSMLTEPFLTPWMLENLSSLH